MFLKTGNTVWEDKGCYLQSDRGVKIDHSTLPLLLNRTVCVERYPEIRVKGKKFRLHNLLMPKKKGFLPDHKNQDKLDNRIENLRYIPKGDNNINRVYWNKSSSYRGVTLVKSHKGKYQYFYWKASISRERKTYQIGRFKTEIEAAYAYNAAAKLIHGELAQLNLLP